MLHADWSLSTSNSFSRQVFTKDFGNRLNKMSGEASKRGGQKKAGGGSASASAAKKNAANLKYANKKKSKERKEQLQKMSKSRCCSWSTLFILVILAGVGTATVKQYPDKVQELYDQLPPQVNFSRLF